jgi:hypothetical protein
MTSKTVTMKTVEYDRMIAGENALREEIVRLLAALKRLHAASQKCWDDDSTYPVTQRDPQVWADWIDAIEAAGVVIDAAEGRDR